MRKTRTPEFVPATSVSIHGDRTAFTAPNGQIWQRIEAAPLGEWDAIPMPKTPAKRKRRNGNKKR